MRLAFVFAALVATSCASEPDPLVRIVSWNMEHLAEANDSGCRPRTDADYAALRAYAAALDADIVAFQEVESAAAAQRVFDPARYRIVIETRIGTPGRLECRGLAGHYLNRQATGFAIRRDIRFERLEDFTALQLGDPNLRSGVDIVVRPRGLDPIRLLSVHLKSGCAGGAGGAECDTLNQQAGILESWIDARAFENVGFAVLGDFNRRLAQPSDAIWAEWDDNAPAPNADLSLAGAPAPAACDPRYTAFIDFFVLDRRAARRASRFHEWTFAGDHLSDHCALSLDLS